MSGLTAANVEAVVEAGLLLKPVLDAWRASDYDEAFRLIEEADADELQMMLIAALAAWQLPVDKQPA